MTTIYPTSRLIILSTTVTTLGLIAYFLSSTEAILSKKQPFAAMNPASALQISISQIETEAYDETSCHLKATIHNTADHVVTLLNWGTPLDPKAGVLGIFEVQDIATDTPIQMIQVLFSRKLPPSSDEVVEISAHDSVTADVVLDRAKPAAGKKYSIRAKGWIQSVWGMSKEEVISKHLEELSGCSSGEFVSNTVEVG